MKTKELIRLLNEQDPTGEEEVCVGNIDIHFVEKAPAYYDGPLQVLERDPNSKYYNIIGAKYKRNGSKIQIHTLSIHDAVSNSHDMEKEFTVDYSELSEQVQARVKESHDNLRKWHKKLDIELEWEYFLEWTKAHASKLTADLEDLEAVAKRFFDEHVSPEDDYPDGKFPPGHSYVSTRKMQWDQKFEVYLDEGCWLKIRKKVS